jgi:thiamine kinase-like enzyme
MVRAMVTETATGFAEELTDTLRALEPLLGAPAAAPVPLDGGITNRNYRVRLGDGDYVIRLAGKDTNLLGISRATERLASEAAAALGIAPRVAAALPNCLVTDFVHATPVEAAALRAQPEPVARALRAFHDSGPALATRFDVPALLDEYAAIIGARGGELPGDYAIAREGLRRIAAALGTPDLVPCHNDLLAGNLLRTRGGEILIVDWEYAGMGERYFDLGNLSVNNDFDEEDDVRLLRAYLGADATSAERCRLALMRIVSDAREAAWGAVQLVLSELDFDFAGYAGRHFARLRGALEDPRFEEWLRGAAA